MSIDYITGAGGFIGKALASRLDRPIAISHQSLSTTELAPCNRFFFLSAYGNLATQQEPELIMQANVVDLTRVLCRFQQVRCNQFIYISSSSVGLPVQTPYSLTKRAGELIVESSGLNSIIVRPFSVTGVGEQSCHLIPRLIHSSFAQEQIPLDPDPVHDFIDVDDLVAGILQASADSYTGVLELGSGTSTSNQQVCDLVAYVTGVRPNTIRTHGMRPYDSSSWVCSSTVPASSKLKSLRQSIEEMVLDYTKRGSP